MEVKLLDLDRVLSRESGAFFDVNEEGSLCYNNKAIGKFRECPMVTEKVAFVTKGDLSRQSRNCISLIDTRHPDTVPLSVLLKVNTKLPKGFKGRRPIRAGFPHRIYLDHKVSTIEVHALVLILPSETVVIDKYSTRTQSFLTYYIKNVRGELNIKLVELEPESLQK
jgi:hypothetical protein